MGHALARSVPGSLALLATAVIASASLPGPTVDRHEMGRLASSDGPNFAGHPFRVTAPCAGRGSLTLWIRPFVNDQGAELMTARFVLVGAEPGSHWTYGVEASGGGSGEAGDGEFTVPEDGEITITKLGRAAHTKQKFRLIATQDQGSVPTQHGASCSLRSVARY